MVGERKRNEDYCRLEVVFILIQYVGVVFI